MKSDIEIAQACPMRHIREIAREVGVEERYLEQYGKIGRASCRERV